jgi:4'-phosphopantetheinyl transferase
MVTWTELAAGDVSGLSDDELDRADRYRAADDRRRFVAGRSWLRSRLSDSTGVAADQLKFIYGPMGKPSLANVPETQFSLSHSGDLAVLAIGRNVPVGVDIEHVRAGAYDRDAAALILADQDLAAIDRSADPESAFLLAWTRKEAFAKVGGEGLERSLATFALGDGGLATHGGISVVSVDLGITGVACAVACAGVLNVELVGRA